MPASYETHRAQLKAILLAWGMPEDNAETTADVLSWADLHGVDSHGISMIPGYDRLRRNGRATFCEVADVPELHASDSPEQILLRSEERNYLEDGLRLLSPRERAALILRDVEGLPAEEVAERLNCSKATVRSHIANARIKFRRYMERRKR